MFRFPFHRKYSRNLPGTTLILVQNFWSSPNFNFSRVIENNFLGSRMIARDYDHNRGRQSTICFGFSTRPYSTNRPERLRSRRFGFTIVSDRDNDRGRSTNLVRTSSTGLTLKIDIRFLGTTLISCLTKLSTTRSNARPNARSNVGSSGIKITI